jgi:hypothetical protein
VTLINASEAPPRLGPDGRPWWREPFRVFQTNLREVDATLDVERTLDAIEAHGSNVWLVNGGGILSFYPSDLPFQTRNPCLSERASGDLLGDAVEAAHRRGVRVVARMDFSKVTERVAAEHPEWLYVDPNGEHQVYQGLASTCPSAGYYQDAAFAVLEEVATRYPVDGFFFNWFGFNEIDYTGRYRGVSQNAESRRRFADWSGGDALPTGPDSPGYTAWRRFSTEVIADLTGRFRAHISTLLPGAAFIRGLASDVVFHEANNEIGRPLWPSATAEAVSSITTARPGQPVFVNSVAFVDMPYRLAAEEPARYEQYIAQTLARGGNPSVYIMGTPGAIDYPNVDAVAPLFRFHRDNADLYTDLVPAARVAVVRPDPLRAAREVHERARAEFRGVYRALQQRHVPFDVLPLADVPAADAALDRYAVILVPDCGELDRTTVDALDRAVEAGSVVILTGSSGATGPALAHTPVESYGAEVADRDLYATYAAGAVDETGHPRFPVVPVYGRFAPIRLRADASSPHRLVPPAPYGPPEKAYGNLASDEPATAVLRVGRGGVVVIPWTIGRSFHDLGLSVSRDLVADTVQSFLDEATGAWPAMRFDLPPHVEVTVMARGDELVVHLVNLSGAQGNGFTTPMPVTGGRIVVSGAVRVHDAMRRESLEVAAGAAPDERVVQLSDFGALAVLRLQPRPGSAETSITDEGATHS